MKKTPHTQDIVLWVGADWADEKHCFFARKPDGSPGQLHWLEAKPKKLDEFFLKLHHEYPGGKIGVVLEKTRGPLVYNLLKHPFVRLYPINPRCLSDFRGTLKASGAKSDPLDCELACELGYKHGERLRPFEVGDGLTRQLMLLTEQRRDLVDHQTAFSNQLTAALKSYYPLAVELFSDNICGTLCQDFLRRWPTLADVKKAKPQVLRSFFYAHRCRSEERIVQRLEAVAQASALTEDPALISVMQLQALSLCGCLQGVQKAIEAYEKRIAEVFATHAKASVFASFPAAGPAMAPRLAAAFGTLEDNFPTPSHLQCLSGVAPVQKQSGKTKVVLFRWARPIFLHQTFVEYARLSVQKSAWANLLAEQLKEKGWSAFRIYRFLAFKWIRIMWRCWKDGTTYDEIRYLKALQKRGVARYQSLYVNEAK